MFRRLSITSKITTCLSTTSAIIFLFAGFAAACEGPLEEPCGGRPVVFPELATKIEARNAILNGTVNPRGCATTYWFEYGTFPGSFTKSTPHNSAGEGGTTVEEHAPIEGLSPATTYYFRIVAMNMEGTEWSSESSFTTHTAAPTVVTEAATGVEEREATLHGLVNPNGAATEYHFEYGTAPESYGTSVPVPNGKIAAGTSNVSEEYHLTGLLPETAYYFRLSATNVNGTINGGPKNFTTHAPKWEVQTTPNPTGAKSSRLSFDSCTLSTACTSVGDYVNSSNVKVPLAERWNGSSWSAQTPPGPTGATWSELLGVSCTSSTWCDAAGPDEISGARKALAESWNGTEWTIQTVSSPSGATSSELSAISCTSSTACTAVGHYTTSSSSPTLAERWNGTSWTVQTTPNPSGATESSLLGVSCASSTACMATGYYYNSSGERKTLAEAWNGETWSIKTTPNRTGATGNILLGVSCTSSSACTAVGGDFPSTGPQETLVERWNGTEWTIQTSQNPSGSEASVLHGAFCTASECTTVGDYVKAGVNMTLAERWNGSSWAIQSTPNPAEATFSALWSVACTSPGVCFAPGYYKNSSGTELALTEKSS